MHRYAFGPLATLSNPLARLLIAAACLVGIAGCRPPQPATATDVVTPTPATLTVLAINDVYRIQGLGAITEGTGSHGGLARLRTLRKQLEAEHGPVLLLHAGDFLAPSLLSRRYRGAQMIDVLNRLDGDPEAFDPTMFVTFGNHEFDDSELADAAQLDRRIEDSQFHWLGSNLWFDVDADGHPLVASANLSGSALVTVGEVTVGLFSLTDEGDKPAYLVDFYDREDTAYDATAKLRAAGAEVVIGLTHLDLADDAALLESLGDRGPDLVVGGHDHQAVARQVNGRWILKADADAVTVRVAHVTPRADGPPSVDHRLVALGPDGPPPDSAVAATVAGWLDRFDREQCAAENRQPGCLDTAVGQTRVELIAEETAIRRFETNLGNWIADRLRQHWTRAVETADPGAPLVALVNSGSLRLNRNLPPGWITRREIDELFAYPAQPVLLRLDGSTLRRMIARSVQNWNAAGHWLQVSGLAFVHDPDRESAERLTLLNPDGARALEDHERVYVATVRYLVDPGIGDQDGYSMVDMSDVVSRSDTDLRDLVVEGLRLQWNEGIAPEKEGRICNLGEDSACLAVDDRRAGRATPPGSPAPRHPSGSRPPQHATRTVGRAR